MNYEALTLENGVTDDPVRTFAAKVRALYGDYPPAFSQAHHGDVQTPHTHFLPTPQKVVIAHRLALS
ncbi:hypothetical protein [Noviherbaspirillum malthae]|uniref:hypothetical protein n=1 Tax=Noviherbaspirillum malthae TaxID=1260987 RepID=UPI00188FC1A2|nr:hypothetical protein [Noviherbaspirillum malthae]